MVIHADLLGQNGGGFSYAGIIWIDDAYENNDEGLNVLRHEYGHYLHMQQIDLLAYSVTIAIPSAIGAAIADKYGTHFQQFLHKNYYSLPWERIADELGGASGAYLQGSDKLAELYWQYTLWWANMFG